MVKLIPTYVILATTAFFASILKSLFMWVPMTLIDSSMRGIKSKDHSKMLSQKHLRQLSTVLHCQPQEEGICHL